MATLDSLKRPLWVLDNNPDLAPNLPRFLKLMGFRVIDLMANDGRIRTTFLREPLGQRLSVLN